MSGGYLACFAGRGGGHLQTILGEGLRRNGLVAHASGGDLLLFADPRLPVREIAGKRGWVIGQLFERSGSQATAHPGIQLSPSGAAKLTKHFWGSYVALEDDGDCLRVVRDPSGGLACYHLVLDGDHFFTSIPHLLFECGLARAEIDWTEIARSLAEHAARGSRTVIRGVDELLAGRLLTLSGGKMEQVPTWSAWDHAAAELIGEPAEALEQILCSTLGAWGRTLRRPLIEISGGLDSAVVAAGMARASPDASLITFAAAPGDPDETPYARAIAERLGLDLAIVQPFVEEVDLGRSLSAKLPRPNARAFTQAADALSLRHGRAIGADAFVSGGGGDDVFCFLRTILPAIDRLRAEGGRAMLSTAMDIAVMNHSTVWEALYRTVRRLVRRRPGTSPVDLRFLSCDVAAQPSSPTGDSEGERADERRPGKAEHVRSVLTIHNYLEGHARAEYAPILSPLLSQPIVECCHSIPAWRWCEGGRNRAVARRAFRDRLPQPVLERRSKGHFDGFCAALFEANRELVRAMLLEGQLARQGLLDRSAIELALRNPLTAAETVARLLALVDVESWTASWLSRAAQRC
jgi:asparagine synthase (glutamine-hydrolysing)